MTEPLTRRQRDLMARLEKACELGKPGKALCELLIMEGVAKGIQHKDLSEVSGVHRNTIGRWVAEVDGEPSRVAWIPAGAGLSLPSPRRRSRGWAVRF